MSWKFNLHSKIQELIEPNLKIYELINGFYFDQTMNHRWSFFTLAELYRNSPIFNSDYCRKFLSVSFF